MSRSPRNSLEPQIDEVTWADDVYAGGDLVYVDLDLRPTGRRQNQKRKPTTAEVLLVPKVLVGRDEGIWGCKFHLAADFSLAEGTDLLRKMPTLIEVSERRRKKASPAPTPREKPHRGWKLAVV